MIRPSNMPTLDLRPRDEVGDTKFDKEMLEIEKLIESTEKGIEKYLTMRRNKLQ